MNEFAFMMFLVSTLAIISSQSHVTEYEILQDYVHGKELGTRHDIKRRAATATNKTSNISIITDNHKYYTSQYYESGLQWWYNLSDGPGRPILHKKSLYSDTVNTTFEFPYYGHTIKQITIMNRGFLFAGYRVHKFNASIQYIAPLMADFDAELNENTKIRYIDTGSRFTAEWTNINLRNQSEVGQFSFQCSILKDGRIVFAYKAVPFPVKKIRNDTFFVRVGLSDSFDIQRIINGIFIDRKTGRIYTRLHSILYYRYHHVKLDKNNVKNGSAFLITPLPNCVLFKTCSDCTQSNLTQFNCKWCPRINRCSDGIDRHRQDWLAYGCYRSTGTTCSLSSPPSPTRTTITTGAPTTGTHSMSEKRRGTGRSGRIAGIVIVVVICLAILMGIVLWCVYAYRRPESKSGTWLLKYGNPAKWCRRSSEGDETVGKQISFKTMPEEGEINA